MLMTGQNESDVTGTTHGMILPAHPISTVMEPLRIKLFHQPAHVNPNHPCAVDVSPARVVGAVLDAAALGASRCNAAACCSPHAAASTSAAVRLCYRPRLRRRSPLDCRMWVFAAAEQCGANGHGVELDTALFAQAQRAVRDAGLNHMITLDHCDAFAVDLSRSSVVTLYLTERGNDQLLPKLQQELPQGARVVSFCWPFRALQPVSISKVDGINLYLYRMGSV